MTQKTIPSSTSKSQCAAILAYLQAGNELTPVEAQVTFNCYRLAARIKDLKARGHKIVTTIKTNPGTGAKYASYRLLRRCVGAKVQCLCTCHKGQHGVITEIADEDAFRVQIPGRPRPLLFLNEDAEVIG